MINCRQSEFLFEQKQQQKIESGKKNLEIVSKTKKNPSNNIDKSINHFGFPLFALFIPAEWRMSLWCRSLRAKIFRFSPLQTEKRFSDAYETNGSLKFLQKGNSMDI